MLPKEILCSAIVFVGRSSFEERSYSAYKELSSCKFLLRKFFASEEEAKEAKELRVRHRITESCVLKIRTNDPLQTREVISSLFREISEIMGDYSIVIDITALRKEELLVLLSEMVKIIPEKIERAYFVYSKASRMGEWLSNNVREVRPVIGYPGEVSNLKRTHLILLVGIEHHRAIAAIQAYEPFSISLGMVPKEKSVNEDVYERNLGLRNYLTRHFEQIRSEFDFSATDPFSLKLKLRALVSDLNDFNIVIAPMNNKLSTLAVGVFALENPKVQLCYSEVDVYNAGNYSQPGNEIIMVLAREIFEITK